MPQAADAQPDASTKRTAPAILLQRCKSGFFKGGSQEPRLPAQLTNGGCVSHDNVKDACRNASSTAELCQRQGCQRCDLCWLQNHLQHGRRLSAAVTGQGGQGMQTTFWQSPSQVGSCSSAQYAVCADSQFAMDLQHCWRRHCPQETRVMPEQSASETWSVMFVPLALHLQNVWQQHKWLQHSEQPHVHCKAR